MYLSLPRGVMGVNGHPAELLPEPHGTPRNATDRKMAELRIKSGIFRILGSAFSLLSSPTHLRRFRVFRISALGVGC